MDTCDNHLCILHNICIAKNLTILSGAAFTSRSFGSMQRHKITLRRLVRVVQTESHFMRSRFLKRPPPTLHSVGQGNEKWMTPRQTIPYGFLYPGIPFHFIPTSELDHSLLSTSGLARPPTKVCPGAARQLSPGGFRSQAGLFSWQRCPF